MTGLRLKILLRRLSVGISYLIRKQYTVLHGIDRSIHVMLMQALYHSCVVTVASTTSLTGFVCIHTKGVSRRYGTDGVPVTWRNSVDW